MGTLRAGLLELFVRSAEAHPARTALSDERSSLSYAGVATAVRAAAERLRVAGAAPGMRIAIALDRGTEFALAILACFELGCAYVPLDPLYPLARIRAMLEESKSSLLVTTPEFAAAIDRFPYPIVDAVNGRRLDSAISLSEPETFPLGEAYVIFTSGSTGRPKGVIVEHRNVVSMLRAALPLFEFSATDRWLLFHSLGFDFSVWELWAPLATGAEVYVAPRAATTDPARLMRLLEAERITVLNQVPSVCRHLVDAIAEAVPPPRLALRYVVFGGERLELDVAAGLSRSLPRESSRPRYVNMYGITEISVHATFYELSEADLAAGSGPCPIGTALPNLSIRLAGEDGAPVGPGEVGEMLIAGEGLARGYTGDGSATRERFVTRDLGDGARRYYSSGDFARLRDDGSLLYCGRTDAQVKVRGFRIELNEIDAALKRHPAIKDAATTVGASPRGEALLVAHVILAPGTAAGPELRRSLRAFLAERLPQHMLPSKYRFADAFPYGISGKLDRTALARSTA